MNTVELYLNTLPIAIKYIGWTWAALGGAGLLLWVFEKLFLDETTW